MTVFIDAACAPLLPARHRFALFRLVAYLRMRHAKPGKLSNRLYFVDRDQSSREQYGIAVWTTASGAALIAGWLATVWPVWAAALAAVPLAAMSLQLPIVLLGTTVLPLWERITGRPVRRIRFHSRVLMSLLIAAALLGANTPGWQRYVAWQVLAVGGSNMIAAAIMWALRREVARVEQSCGAP